MDTEEEEIIAETSLEEGETKGEVTLHAVNCHTLPSNLKLTAVLKGTKVQVLIDSRSTNTFMDPSVLQKLRIKATKTYPLIVIVTNGNRTISMDEVSQLSWEMQNQRFSADPRVLKLADCQMVLGVDWLKDLSPVTFDFKNLTL